MFKHLLIPTDGSALSDRAVKNGLKLARSLGARVTVLAASRPFRLISAEPLMLSETKEAYERGVKVRTRASLELARDCAQAADVRCYTAHVSSDRPYQAILETAEARDCDVVFLTSPPETGVAALLGGTDTQRVLANCKVPVLLWR
jgi:nucleotide-binding universal stress UspA family protein